MSDAVGQRPNAPVETRIRARTLWPRDLAAVLVAGLIAFALAALAVSIFLRA